MATIQQNGSSVTGTYLSGGSTRNNRGVAINAGAPNTRLIKVNLGGQQSAVGSVVVDREITNRAVSNGIFSYNTQRPIGARLPVVIGSSLSDILLGLATVPSQIRSIHKIESRRVVRKATAMRAGNFNLITGKFTVNPVSATDNFGSDVAASPTRSVPGKLVYKLGSDVPVRTSYKPKTGG